MKPEWKDAPNWANWFAKDRNGVWHWFEYEPEISLYGDYWSCSRGRSEIVKEHTIYWKKTLEKRKTKWKGINTEERDK